MTGTSSAYHVIASVHIRIGYTMDDIKSQLQDSQGGYTRRAVLGALGTMVLQWHLPPAMQEKAYAISARPRIEINELEGGLELRVSIGEISDAITIDGLPTRALTIEEIDAITKGE